MRLFTLTGESAIISTFFSAIATLIFADFF
jgi:hypothetical protein